MNEPVLVENMGAVAAFVRTVEAGGFTAASRQLGVSPSAVSKSVARLEAALGAQLLQRTTRRVALTAAGARFHERCVRALGELSEAERELAESARAVHGEVRVSVPQVVALRLLLPALPEFRRRYPEVRLRMDLDDRLVDLLVDGYDAAVRMGRLRDSRLRARRLGPNRFVLCAAPEYLRRRGAPRAPEDLAAHECIRFRFPSTGRIEPWALRAAGAAERARVPETWSFNNTEAVLAAACAGLGVAQLPSFVAEPALAAGALRHVLGEFMVERGALWMLWPPVDRPRPAVRALVDFIADAVRRGTSP
ncbi:LysR family transcriptional regulator [Sorangium sp. So ce1335]|uniref:LysR family transcriptional regulator n=1 Tax=Sorangium sp. So ce1335 TaxID=3133335 RepID=UPI003F5DF53B